MSFLGLRRRAPPNQSISNSSNDNDADPNDSSRDATPSRAPTPTPDASSSHPEHLRVVSAQKLEALKKKTKQKANKGSKRQKAWIFGLGGIFGLVLAGFFAQSNDMIDFTDLAGLTGMDLSAMGLEGLQGLMDVLPAAFVRDAKELQKRERDAVSYDSFAVGLHARSQGIRATHPVIMIPGVISSGLESWSTEEPSRQYFRKRLWGSWTMMRALVLDKASWKKNIMLDRDTGLDPPGVKLRAAQGFDATDFFITGYWIWNKILENLATVGYDPTNAFTAAYDWRLAYANYEVRDQYFTRLKAHIETAVRVSNKKAVLLSHSMGSQVLYYFFKWVEAEGHGNGGSGWVEAYIDSWINISGCMLGTAKGMPAVLSGEMKDTAQLNAFAVYGLEKFLSRNERAEIFRAMPGISSMLPMGGEAVWGNERWAPDDLPGQEVSFGRFLRWRESEGNGNANASVASILGGKKEGEYRNMTVGESREFLFQQTEEWYQRMMRTQYSAGVAHSAVEVSANNLIPSKWINPLETSLPNAPSLKIYCFYGIGKETERAYYYRPDTDPLNKNNVTIDTSHTSTSENVDHGVVLGEGDGTVNLLSTGYMCAKGWNIKRYNPGGVKVKIFEMPHEPDRFSPRGGPNTGDHVDILGRSSLNDLILRVAGGKGELIEENIQSNIREYADKVRVYDEEDPEDVLRRKILEAL